MTDPVDELLRDTGTRWREAQPPPKPVDPALFAPRSPLSRWGPLAAAATVVALVAGVVAFVHDAEPERATTLTAVANPYDGLVVRDGDHVEASGLVDVLADGRAVFCGNVPIAASNPPIFGCEPNIYMEGLDLNRLIHPFSHREGRAGSVHVRGRLAGGVLTVTEQLDTLPPSRELPPRDVPCRPPDGGWSTESPDTDQLHDYIDNLHPGWFSTPRVGQADGRSVFVVSVVAGDLEVVRRELRDRFGGNLCLVDARGRRSLAEGTAIRDAVRDLARNRAYGINTIGGSDVVNVGLPVVTPELAEKFAGIAADLRLEPSIRPVS